ncbi:MAG: carboxypeptidase regulatory-like domain-containing protein [Candidatus Hydrogenedentota bacterium]
MSERFRMIGIVVFFLLMGGVIGIVMSGYGVVPDGTQLVEAPEFDVEEASIPEFEFDESSELEVSGQEAFAVEEMVEAESDVVLDEVASGSISGRVYDSDSGEGIAGATLTFFPHDTPGAKRSSAVTDEEGNYVMAELIDGNYTMQPGVVAGYNTRERFKNLREVIVADGKAKTGVDFAMSMGMRISGVLVNPDGEPVANARVMGYDDEGMRNDRARTDSEGKFVLAGFLQSSRIRIAAEAKGFALPIEYINIGKKSIKDIQLVMVPQGKFSGLVVDQNGKGLPDVQLNIQSQDAMRGDMAKCGPIGNFEFDGLPPGTYDFYLQSSMHRTGIRKPLVTVKLGAGEHRKDIRIELKVGSSDLTISGRVVNDLGEAIVGADLWGRGTVQTDLKGASGDDGEFQFMNLSAGTYRIYSELEGHQQMNQQIAAGTSDVELVLLRTGIISGRIVSTDTSEAIKDYGILVLNNGRKYNPPNDTHFRMRHDDNGAFLVDDAHAGKVRLVFRAVGYATSEVLLEGVVSGETLGDVTVYLKPEVKLSGTVRDTTGTGVSGAFVYLDRIPDEQHMLEAISDAITDKDGRFEIASLGAGEITVSVYAKGYKRETVASVLSGLSTEVNVVLDSGATIEGRVFVNGVAQGGVKFHGSLKNFDGRHGSLGLSDAQGNYHIAGLDSGTFHLGAVYFDGANRRSLRERVVIESGMVSTHDFHFAPASSSVEGYITSGPGQTVRQYVNLSIDTGDGTETRNAKVGDDGYYLFEGIPAGHVTLRGSTSDPYFTRIVTGILNDGETLRLDINLQGGANVTFEANEVPDGHIFVVILVPEHYALPAVWNEDTLPALTEERFPSARDENNGIVQIQHVQSGQYTAVAYTFNLNANQRIDYNTIQVGTTNVQVSGDADVALSVLF